MRHLFSRLRTGTMIAGAALLVAACGHSENASNAADTNMTDMNTLDSSAGLTNDASAVDATAADANLAGDAGAPAADNAAAAGNGTNQM